MVVKQYTKADGERVEITTCGNQFEVIKIRDIDIIKNIKHIQNYKSPGPDGIAGEALKLGGEAIVPYLRVLFTVSLNNGKIPADWRSAIVVPIQKADSRSNLNNYRPISLTSVVSKQMEKLVADYIRRFRESKKWINEAQHGFRKNYSCDTQLTAFVQDIAETLDRGKQMDAVVVDFSKAFDKMDHRLLIEKVAKMGIDARVVRWIGEFLSHRTQRVRVGSKLSSESEIESGVPQGSILG